MDIQQDWTQVDDLIMHMMQTYPSLYPSRVECWCALFSSYGCGYEWDLETGQLVYPYKDQQRQIPLDGPYLEEIESKDDKLLVFSKERTNLLREHTWTHIYLAVQDFHHSTCEIHISGVYSVSWDNPRSNYFSPGLMQQACMNRDKIAKEWRYEIAKFCKWIKQEVYRFCYSPGKHQDKGIIPDKEIIAMLEKSDIRRIYEMKKAYIAAINVLNNIFTKEERKKHKKSRKEMLKMVREIVQRS